MALRTTALLGEAALIKRIELHGYIRKTMPSIISLRQRLSIFLYSISKTLALYHERVKINLRRRLDYQNLFISRFDSDEWQYLFHTPIIVKLSTLVFWIYYLSGKVSLTIQYPSDLLSLNII